MQKYAVFCIKTNLKQYKNCLKRYKNKIFFVYLHPICIHLMNIYQYLLATTYQKKAGMTECTALKQMQ